MECRRTNNVKGTTPMTYIATVTADLELRLVVPGGPSLPVLAGLRYDSDDPWAVRVAFQTGGEGDGIVEWMFARQLLTDGVAKACGEGDIRVWPSMQGSDHFVNLAMASPSGAALFEIDRDALVEFLQQTYLAVPTGHESDAVDFDAELAELLGGR
ncbi:MAG: sporulation and cell division protein SsgA [Frankiales bacterium]|nr:sporulation and cell division protein SsgA [Frankiales bacterium]